MTPEDQEIFFCDLKKLNWTEYFTVYLKGIREYLIQDPMTTLNDARNKWKRYLIIFHSFNRLLRFISFTIPFRLYVLHQTLKVLLGFLCLRLLWSVLQFIQSFMW